MKPEQIKKLTELSASLKDTASHLPTRSKRAEALTLLADACILLTTGAKDGAERLVEQIQLKGDRETETAMLQFLKILLEMP